MKEELHTMPRTIWRVTEDKSVDQDATTEQALWKSQVAEVVVKASSTHKHHIWTRRSATAATPDQALYIKDNESLRRLSSGECDGDRRNALRLCWLDEALWLKLKTY